MKYTTSVGLDVHARSIKAAALVHETGEVVERSFAYCASDLIKWIKTLPKPTQCVYESGPTGFDLLRKLQAANITCDIGAVSKMLRPSGDKIKTDKKDAIFLARMLAVDNVVKIYVPTIEDEAARDLARAREDVRQELTRAKQLVSKFLLRKGIVYDKGKSTWTHAYRKWLETIELSTQTEKFVLNEYLLGVKDAEYRRERIDRAIDNLVKTERWSEVVKRLSLIRGVSTVTAFSVAAEIGDFTRFKNASAFYSYLGLVPSLSESGESSTSGSITKTGNSHVRKLLIESAWHHRRRLPRISQQVSQDIDSHIVRHAQKANLRLHERSIHLLQRKLHSCKVNVAVAREMAGFIWALAKDS